MVPQIAGSIPLHTNVQARTSGSTVAPGTQAETPVAEPPAMTTASSATTVAAVSDTTQAQIDAFKQEWRQVPASMQEISSPSVVQGQANKALRNTAQT